MQQDKKAKSLSSKKPDRSQELDRKNDSSEKL